MHTTDTGKELREWRQILDTYCQLNIRKWLERGTSLLIPTVDEVSSDVLSKLSSYTGKATDYTLQINGWPNSHDRPQILVCEHMVLAGNQKRVLFKINQSPNKDNILLLGQPKHLMPSRIMVILTGSLDRTLHCPLI